MASPVSRFETLASGYGLVEGPTEDPEGAIVFSDVIGGGVHRRTRDGSIETLVPKRRGVGGIALHAEGGVVVSGRDIVHQRDGETRTLYSIPGLPGWNDLCTDAEGRVYAGALRFAVLDPQADPVAGECFRIEAEGRATELYGGVIHANGIGVSPYGPTLFHSDTRRRVVVVHRLEGGRATERRELPIEEPGMPDGLAIDERGCVWIAIVGGGRVDCLRPDGLVDERLEVPASLVTSVCFAGPDRRDLIVTTGDNRQDPARRGTIFRTRVSSAGLPVHPAQV